MRFLIIAFLLFMNSCGQNSDNKNSSNNPQPNESENSQTSSGQDDPYLALINSCSERDGNIMVDGNCLPAEVSLSLDGTLALGGVGSDKKVYSVRINQANDFFASSPYLTVPGLHGQKITSLDEKYDVENRKFFTTTRYLSDFGLRFILFENLYRKRVKISTNIFGLSLDPHSITLENIQAYCKDITQRFLEEKPSLRDRDPLIHNPQQEWMNCRFIVAVPPDREVPEFESFSITWGMIDGEIYLQKIFLDSYLSMSEEARRGNF